MLNQLRYTQRSRDGTLPKSNIGDPVDDSFQ